MKSTALIVAATLALGACAPESGGDGPPAAEASPAVHEAANLGVAFVRGEGLEPAPCEGMGPRCVVIVDPTAEASRRELYTVQVFDGALEAVAAAEAGFERNDEGRLMTTYGRFEPMAVESFRSGELEGLRAVVTCGISDPETGFHAAAGECLWAVLSDGRRSAVISSTGYAEGLAAAEAAARSLTFLPAEQASR